MSACVETKAKRQYERLVNELLEKGDEGDLAEKLEILRLFLESTDFSKLRNEYEKHLLEERRVKFRLYLVKGKPEYEVRVK